MKKFYALILWLVILTGTGCGNDPIADRIWSGTLSRTADGKLLSEVCLMITGDTLRIYSNAIFGCGNECLFCRNRQKGNYLFTSPSGEEFPMAISYSNDKAYAIETLFVEGPEYQMELSPATVLEFTPELLHFYKGQEVPRQAELYLSGRWMGEIIRTRDKQRLSAVCLEFAGDTLKVFANAIFGKKNELLFFDGYRTDSFYFTNTNNTFLLRPMLEGDRLSLTGDDFAMELAPMLDNWEEALSFYKAYDLPRNADGYHFGTYTGQGIGRIENANLLSVMLGVPSDLLDIRLNLTLTFLEGCRVRTTMDSGLVNPQMRMLNGMTGGGSSNKQTQTVTYKISGNQLLCPQEKYIILPDGDLLLPAARGGGVKHGDILLRRQR